MWLQSHLAAKLSKCNSCRAASCHASKIEIFALSFCLSYKHAPSFFMAQLIINFNSHVSELAGLLGPRWSNQLWTHLLVNNYSRHWGGGELFSGTRTSPLIWEFARLEVGGVCVCVSSCSALGQQRRHHTCTHTPSDPISEPFWVMHYKVSWRDPDSLPSLFLYSILSSNTFLRDKFASICLLLLLQLFSWLSSTMLDCQ